jgi:predicted amidophosphoribosyltransferase
MLVCDHCGKVIEDWEYSIRDEYCDCGGDFVEATECKVCGTWFDNEELHGVCEACLEKHSNLETVIAMGEENRANEYIPINGFYEFLLTPEKINEILGEWVKENIDPKDRKISEYLDTFDSFYVSDFVAGEI